MKRLYDKLAFQCSEEVTRTYSTSFSLAIKVLSKEFHKPIYSIYGFVRFADEIVDSFHENDKEALLARFRVDAQLAIKEKVSLNPILHSFQSTVNEYGVEWELIDTFLKSMEMDLKRKDYDREGFDVYVLGSAEVVGLICLRIFCKGNALLYDSLKEDAKKLGAAFQKINFLRDMCHDHQQLGRTYFPDLDMTNFDKKAKAVIEQEIENDFKQGYRGIKNLPKKARFGVYLAYIYYYALFKKIKAIPPARILEQRVRVTDSGKIFLFVRSYLWHILNLV